MADSPKYCMNWKFLRDSSFHLENSLRQDNKELHQVSLTIFLQHQHECYNFDVIDKLQRLSLSDAFRLRCKLWYGNIQIKCFILNIFFPFYQNGCSIYIVFVQSFYNCWSCYSIYCMYRKCYSCICVLFYILPNIQLFCNVQCREIHLTLHVQFPQITNYLDVEIILIDDLYSCYSICISFQQDLPQIGNLSAFSIYNTACCRKNMYNLSYSHWDIHCLLLCTFCLVVCVV